MAAAGDRYDSLTGNIWSYAHRGDLTGVKAALFRGVDINMMNTVGWTACHAAAAGGHPRVLRFLAKRGADLAICDRGGNLPVHEAAKSGHVNALRALGDLGADVASVRLSHTKGQAVRDYVKEALVRRQGSISSGGGGSSSQEEPSESRVGYSRKQAKSTAFFGPRKTPISGKIKKKILRSRRRAELGRGEA